MKDSIDRESEVNIHNLIKPFILRWCWFILSVIGLVALAFIYLKVATPIYRAESTILIKDSRKSPGPEINVLSQLGGFGGSGANSIDNEMEILKSKKMMREVVSRLGLQTSIQTVKNLSKTERYGTNSPIYLQVVNEKNYEKKYTGVLELEIRGDKITITSEDFPQPIVTTYKRTISLPYANIIILKNPGYVSSNSEKLTNFKVFYATKERTVNAYQKMLNVQLVNKDATVISLAINTANQQKGKDVINKLVEAYNNDAIGDKNSESKKTKEFIDERIGIIANELGEVESEKERFKVSNNIIDIPSEASYNFGGAEAAKAKLLDNETQIELTDILVGNLKRSGNSQTLPASVGLGNPLAAANINAYNQLVLERNRLLENATPSNPVVADVNKQINVLKTSVLDVLLDYKNNLQQARSQLQTEANRFAAKVSKVPAQEKLFRSIERQQQIKENLYLLLLQKREEAAISLAITTPKARIIDLAYVSENPVSPKKLIVLASAAVLGFLIPFGIIYLKELLNNKIRSKEELEQITPSPILGEIPTVTKNQGEVIEVNDLSPMSEAFRILATNINFMLPKKEKGKVVFVSSSVKGEGKTFISLNLALTFASSKNKTIIIGADIRNPQLQRYDVQKKSVGGLTEYLYDTDTSIKGILHTSPFNPNLDMIYSGSIPPNPTELLSNGRFKTLIDTLKQEYHIIIVDTAPLLLVTDTFLTADLADATLYVVRSNYTEKTLLNFVNKQVESKKIKNVGLVLNDVDKNYFGYGNKYGYGYSNTERSWFQKLKDKL